MGATYEEKLAEFNNFLNLNKDKIDKIVPLNPTISKDDEWNNEECWDDYSESEQSVFE